MNVRSPLRWPIVLTFLLPLILVACATPQEQCLNRAGAKVRNLEERIEVARGNIDRGYAVHISRSRPTVGFCSGYYGGYYRYGGVSSCVASDPGPREQAVPIDVAEERAKLQRLEAALVRERDAFESAAGRCRAAFPE